MMEEGEQATSKDLYGDIESLSKSILIDQLQRQLEEKDLFIKSQEEDLHLVKSQFTILLSEKNTVEKNMITLYNTAVRELQRKDRELSEMRELLRKNNKKSSSAP